MSRPAAPAARRCRRAAPCAAPVVTAGRASAQPVSAAKRLRLDQVDTRVQRGVVVELKERPIALVAIGNRDPEVVAATVGTRLRLHDHRGGAILSWYDICDRPAIVDSKERPGDRKPLAAIAADVEVEADLGSDRVRFVPGLGERRAFADQMIAKVNARKDRSGDEAGRAAEARSQPRRKCEQ